MGGANEIDLTSQFSKIDHGSCRVEYNAITDNYIEQLKENLGLDLRKIIVNETLIIILGYEQVVEERMQVIKLKERKRKRKRKPCTS